MFMYVYGSLFTVCLFFAALKKATEFGAVFPSLTGIDNKNIIPMYCLVHFTVYMLTKYCEFFNKL